MRGCVKNGYGNKRNLKDLDWDFLLAGLQDDMSFFLFKEKRNK